MSYDKNFRRRAVEYWNDGHSQRKTAKVFKISPTTLQSWKNQFKETGKSAPKKRRKTWRKIDPKTLVYIDERGRENGWLR